jgi:benzoyl-CoA reductase/2-hydroxyglutaryl-CoA dehydratase subunit BcrC/BadD/HgdB
MRRLFDVWCTHLSPGFAHCLALPHLATPEAAALYAAELEKFVDTLNKHFALDISDSDLRSGIRIVNETRRLLQELKDVHRTSGAISDKEFFEILRDAMSRPKEDFNPWLRHRLDEVGSAVKNARHGINIVLAGGVLDDTGFLDVITDAGGTVVADDMCFGSRYYRELTSLEEPPLAAIANRYIFRTPCARMFATEERVEHLLRLVEESNASGLIYFMIKFCDPHALDWVTLARKLHARGISVLHCESDYSTGGRERMKIRIEAFMEILR